MGKTREVGHQAFFQWLRQTLADGEFDVLLVAGDIFDTSTPPSYARELYHQLLVDLQPLQVQVIMLGGNHDSVAVLSESASLLRCIRTWVVPGLANNLNEHVIPLYQRSGEIGAMLVALPFVRTRELSAVLGLQSAAGQTEQQKQHDIQSQLSRLYHQLYEEAQKQAQQLRPDVQLPIIGTGHLTTIGASRTESEREIYIGTLEAFRVEGFPAFDYLALGHIHQCQQVGGKPQQRYSGSPLALSFAEAKQQKYVVAASVTPAQPVTVDLLPLPEFQPLRSLRGSLPDVLEQIKTLPSSSQPPIWVELVLTGEDALLSDLQQQLEHAFEGKSCELLRLRRERVEQRTAMEQQLSLHELSAEDVFRERLNQETLEPDSVSQLWQLHQQALELLAEQEQTS